MIARARWGTTLTFALGGLLCSVWVVRMPALKDAFGMDPGDVGFLLLAWGLSALIAMQTMRGLLLRIGSHTLLRISVPLTAVSLAGIALVPNYTWLVGAIIVDGIVFGVMDVAMNSQAVTVERAHGGSIMNGMHAGWSIGALAGNLMAVGTIALGMTFTQTFLLGAAIGLPLALLLGFTYLPDGGAERAEATPKGKKLPPVVYLIGGLAFAAFLVEGSIADWSGLYLRDELGAIEAVAGLGYAVFELAMIIGRLCGDRLRVRFGSRTMLAASGVTTAAAVTGLIVATGPTAGLVALFIGGLAVCTVIPITMSLAGAAGGAQSGAAVAQTGVFGYTGLLLGPVMLGFVADHSTIGTALWIVVFFALLIALGSRVARVEQAALPAVSEPEVVGVK